MHNLMMLPLLNKHLGYNRLQLVDHSELDVLMRNLMMLPLRDKR